MSGLKLVRALTVVSAAAVLMACASSSPPAHSDVSTGNEWEPTTCLPQSLDAAAWPRYRLGAISIAVPPEYRRQAPAGSIPAQIFGRVNSTLTISLTDDSRASFDALSYRNRASVRCGGSFGRYPAEAVAWQTRDRAGLMTFRVEVMWQGLEPRTVVASINAERLSDAIALRSALHTIAVGAPGQR